MIKVTIEDSEDTKNPVRVTDLEPAAEKALRHVACRPGEWVENAVLNRVRVAVNEIVKTHSDRQPNKTPMADKLAIVAAANIESAAERQEKFEAESHGAAKRAGGSKRRRK